MKQILLLILSFIFIHHVNAQGWGQTQKIVASDRGSEAEFGFATAMHGDYALIGARLDHSPALYAGAVYVYKNDGSGNWAEIQKLVAPDQFSNDFFGFSVAIDANTLIVGARNQDRDSPGSTYIEAAGAAYFFEKNGADTWSFVQKIVAPDRADSDVFGESVAISGDYAVVMAPLEDEDENDQNTLNAAGSAYVFERDINGNWGFAQKLVLSERDEADTIGRESSVSIDGNTIAIGAPLDDEEENGMNTINNAGAVYVFERNGSGVWNETQKIIAPARFESDIFGSDVAIDGNYMVIGSALKDIGNSDSGSAYVFKKNGGIWQEQQQLVSSNSGFDYRFGKTVDIDDNRLVVGAFNEEVSGNSFAGAAYVFERDGSDFWNLEARIGALDADVSDNFSLGIAISGDYVIGGAYREDEDENGGNSLSRAGSAYVFNANEPNTLSVVENNFESSIKAYPNPVKEIFNIDLGQYYSKVDITISNILGQQMFFQNYQNIKSIELPFNMQKGMYLVEVEIENTRASVLKIVKH